MNKVFKFTSLIFILAILFGCSNNNDQQESATQESAVETQAESEIQKEPNSESAEVEKANKLDQVKKQLYAKDKNVILVWQEACPPCEIQLKVINQLYEKYPEINFIGLGIAESKENYEKYLSDKELTFNNLWIDANLLKDLTYEVTTTPTILFLNQEGKEIRVPQIGSQFNLNELEEATKRFEEIITEL